MMRPSQHLREEHQTFHDEIERLRRPADRVGVVPGEELAREVAKSSDFLLKTLIPHAEVEDAVLYPKVAMLMGAASALDPMRFEHGVIGGMARELEALVPEIAARGAEPQIQQRCRQLLYGLHAVVSTHFRVEEEVLLPILDAKLPAAAVEPFLSELEAAARRHAHASA